MEERSGRRSHELGLKVLESFETPTAWPEAVGGSKRARDACRPSAEEPCVEEIAVLATCITLFKIKLRKHGSVLGASRPYTRGAGAWTWSENDNRGDESQAPKP
ncbi:hypothetical protein L1887_48612 [Cichorium endivia]|nr:hypothetical protein L1887_48612 [Cichorium endivia]